MNERQYLEAIEELRKAGACRTSPQSAKRYAAQLRAGSELTLRLQAEGICGKGQTAFDLTEEAQLEVLNRWQALQNLDDRSRAAIKLLLQAHNMEPLNKRSAERQLQLEAKAEQEQAASDMGNIPNVRGVLTLKQMSMREPETPVRTAEPPLSLYGLLSALRQTTKKRRAVVEEKAYTLLMRALLQRKDFQWNTDTTEADLRIWGSRYDENAALILANLQDETCRQETLYALEDALLELEDLQTGPQLRLDVARACEYIERKMEDWFMNHLLQAGDYSHSQARFLLGQLASMKKGAGAELYSDITDSALTEKVADLFVLAIEAAEGKYTATASLEEQLVLLTEEERDMLAAAGCGLPVSRSLVKKPQYRYLLLQLSEKGLLAARADRLVLAYGLKPLPLTGLADGKGSLKGGLAPELLLQLLQKGEALHMESEARGMLLHHLEELAGELHAEEPLRHVLRFLLSWYWNRKAYDNPKTAIQAMERLLSWYERQPELTAAILKKMMNENPWDAELRLTRHSGSSLLEAELQSQCAQRCLELALKGDREGYWTAAAVNGAKKALYRMEALEDPFLLLQSHLTLALGLALQAGTEAELSDSRWPYTGRSLVTDCLIPCLENLDAAESLLQGGALSGAAAQHGRELLETMRQACCTRMTAKESPVRKCLERQVLHYDEGNWFDLQWIRSEGLKQLADCDLLQVMHHYGRPAKLFLPWYCNTFDSTLSCGPACTQERTEAAFLNILLSGQKVTMAANQMVDNEKLWNMAEIPAFLWMLRRGYVSVSLFGQLQTLMDYAVTRMRNPNFIWSSLPDDFAEVPLREMAADFLEGKLPASQLPEEHRGVLTKMRDAVRLMDENLPACWRSYYHQQNEAWTAARGIGPMIGLGHRMAAYYGENRDVPNFSEMQKLNGLLVQANPNLDRSVYRKMVWAVRDQDYGMMEGWGISPALLEQQGIPAEYLAHERQDMLEDMIRIVDDCQNRMLGERISTHQYYVYDEASSRIVPEWHAEPVNAGGHLLYRQTEREIQDNGRILGWEQVPERMSALETLASENPDADAERLCSKLAGQGLTEYGTFGLEGSLRLQSLAFKASSGRTVERTLDVEEGSLYQMERNLKGEEK